MKYVLLICGYPSDWDRENVVTPECERWVEETKREGLVREVIGLEPPRDASTVRVRDGEVLVSDGPFAETKDQVGGFALVECDDLATAVAVAARHPAAKYGSVEVRPVWAG